MRQLNLRLARAVWARMAKMSRMRLVRSIIRIFRTFSMLRSCFADNSSSKMTTYFVFFIFTKASISSSLPFPTKVTGLGISSLHKTFPGSKPAVSARKASSSRYLYLFFVLFRRNKADKNRGIVFYFVGDKIFHVQLL